MDVIDQRITQVTIALLQQVGDGFTMDQLAAQANVPRATLYRRVGSKAALLQRLATEQGITLEEQDIRTRILFGARQIFGRLGPINATMDQIADAAGVGVATVYRHFGDKEQLIWAFVDEMSPRSFVRDLVQPSADIAADLTTLVRTLLSPFYEYRDILRFILTGSDAERAYIERLRTGSDRSLDQIASYFAVQIATGRLRPTAQPQELALALLGLLFAFAVIGPTHYNTTLDDPVRISGLLVELFMNGLKPAII